jgi:hypothetical protein
MAEQPRRRWTTETIQETLEPLVAELGRMPTRKELADRGLSGLTSAMQRHGGAAEWRERMTPVRAVTHAEIAERAYFIALSEQGGDPLAHWLAAERELATV